MNILSRAFHTLCAWLGLADASESHPTPSHGWLLPIPAEAREQRQHSETQRTALAGRNTRA